MAEVMVSLSIVALMAAVVMPRYRLLHKRSLLLQDAHTLSENLRKAQEMALSGKKEEGAFPESYGVYLEKSDKEYYIYADMDGDNDYTTADLLIETVELKTDVLIKNLPGSPSSINFSPPDPGTEIQSDYSSYDEIFIVLGIEGTSYEKSVYINKAGLTYVE